MDGRLVAPSIGAAPGDRRGPSGPRSPRPARSAPSPSVAPNRRPSRHSFVARSCDVQVGRSVMRPVGNGVQWTSHVSPQDEVRGHHRGRRRPDPRRRPRPRPRRSRDRLHLDVALGPHGPSRSRDALANLKAVADGSLGTRTSAIRIPDTTCAHSRRRLCSPGPVWRRTAAKHATASTPRSARFESAATTRPSRSGGN